MDITASPETRELVAEWVHELAATQPGELWWENLVAALAELGAPAIPLLVEYLTDSDRSVAEGAAEASQRILTILQARQAAAKSRWRGQMA